MSRRAKLSLVIAAPLAGFLLLLGLLAGGLSNDPRELPSALIDKPLPAFRAERLDAPGQTVTAADLSGEVALLNVWATWCPTCRAEHEFLHRLVRDRQMTIYGINYKDNRAEALDWLATLGDPYRFNVYDEQGQLGIDLGVYGAPETYLLDANGTIRYRHVGELNERVWQREFVPRLAALR